MFFQQKCKHFYGTVQPDGFQYCSKCGDAKSVRKECNHKWEEVTRINIWDQFVSNDKPIHYKWVLRCTKCGNMKNHES